MRNPVVWIEIPVKDMERAIKFYNTIFNWNLQINLMGPLKMAWFPSAENAEGASGTLVYHEMAYKVASENEGPLVYFGCEDIDDILKKLDGAGGKLIKSKTMISEEHGHMALLLDSEGNRIALYSK
jgi:predicted enzyme related to lactoylglutathione lyase